METRQILAENRLERPVPMPPHAEPRNLPIQTEPRETRIAPHPEPRIQHQESRSLVNTQHEAKNALHLESWIHNAEPRIPHAETRIQHPERTPPHVEARIPYPESRLHSSESRSTSLAESRHNTPHPEPRAHPHHDSRNIPLPEPRTIKNQDQDSRIPPHADNRSTPHPEPRNNIPHSESRTHHQEPRIIHAESRILNAESRNPHPEPRNHIEGNRSESRLSNSDSRTSFEKPETRAPPRQRSLPSATVSSADFQPTKSTTMPKFPSEDIKDPPYENVQIERREEPAVFRKLFLLFQSLSLSLFPQI